MLIQMGHITSSLICTIISMAALAPIWRAIALPVCKQSREGGYCATRPCGMLLGEELLTLSWVIELIVLLSMMLSWCKLQLCCYIIRNIMANLVHPRTTFCLNDNWPIQLLVYMCHNSVCLALSCARPILAKQARPSWRYVNNYNLPPSPSSPTYMVSEQALFSGGSKVYPFLISDSNSVALKVGYGTPPQLNTSQHVTPKAH